MFSKQDFIKSVVLIWIIGSTIYIVYDTWTDYKVRGIQQAYQVGVNDFTKELFDKSQANQCKQPIEVTFGGNKMQLIDVKCLQQAQQAGSPQGTADQIQPKPPVK